jgi:hypothetical protein
MVERPLLAGGVVVLIQVAAIGRLVRCAGDFEQVAVGDVPVQLGVPLRIGQPGVVVVAWRQVEAHPRHRTDRTGRRAGRGTRALDALSFHRGEHIQLVLDQRTADIGIGRGGGGLVVAAPPIKLAGFGAAFAVIDVARIALQCLGLPQQLSAEMPFVGAALADLADHAAVGTAECRAIAAAEDFFLVDRAVGQGQSAEAADRIGGVEAVDVIRVLGDRGTAERNELARRRSTHAHAHEGIAAFHRTGREQGDRLGAARQRQPGQLLRGDHGARVDLGHVDRRQAVGGDRHRRQVLRIRSCERHLGPRTHVQLDVVARIDGLPVALQGDGVGAQRQRADRVAARCVDRHLPGDARLVLHFHRAARGGRRLAEDVAGGGLCMHGRRGDAVQGERDGEAEAGRAGVISGRAISAGLALVVHGYSPLK